MSIQDKVKINKLTTGVPGLDEIVGGGLPEFSFNTVSYTHLDVYKRQVPQHLDGGFAEDREIERGPLRSSIGKDELVCQRCLAAAGGSRDDVERKFGEAAAHNFVETGNSGG